MTMTKSAMAVVIIGSLSMALFGCQEIQPDTQVLVQPSIKPSASITASSGIVANPLPSRQSIQPSIPPLSSPTTTPLPLPSPKVMAITNATIAYDYLGTAQITWDAIAGATSYTLLRNKEVLQTDKVVTTYEDIPNQIKTVAENIVTTYTEVPNMKESAWYEFQVVAFQGQREIARSPGFSSTAPFAGQRKWTATTGLEGGSISTPALGSEGTLYVIDKYGTLYAFDSKDGSEKWIFSTPHINKKGSGIDLNPNLSVSSPVIGPNGTIYMMIIGNGAPYPGGLYAINPNGTKKWFTSIENDVSSSPAIGPDGTIYVGSSGDRTYYYLDAINPDGSIKWRFQGNQQKTGASVGYNRVSSSPVIGSDGTIYVGGSDYAYMHPQSSLGLKGGFSAINPDGTLKWIFQENSDFPYTASIGKDNTIYVPTGRLFYAINPDGTKKWSHFFDDSIVSTAVLDNQDTIYAHTSQILYSLNADGTTKAQYDFNQSNNKWSYGFNLVNPSCGHEISPFIANNGLIYLTTVVGISPDMIMKEHMEKNDICAGATLDSKGIMYGIDGIQVIGYYTTSKGFMPSGWVKFGANLMNTGFVDGQRFPTVISSPVAIPSVAATIPPSENGRMVSGMVYDNMKNPIDGALVKIKSFSSEFPYTNQITTIGGKYEFQNVPVGIQVEMTATKMGYSPRRRVEVVYNKQDTNLYNFGGPTDSSAPSLDSWALSDKPEVIVSTPRRHETKVSRTTSFMLTFSEPMETTSVEDNFAIRQYSDDLNNVSGNLLFDKDTFNISWNAAQTEVTFTFKSGLQMPADMGSDFQISFTAQGQPGTIKDKNGGIQSDYQFKLTDGPFERSIHFSL